MNWFWKKRKKKQQGQEAEQAASADQIILVNHTTEKQVNVQGIREKQIGKCKRCGCEITDDIISPSDRLCEACYYKDRIFAGSLNGTFWKFDEDTNELRIYGYGCVTALRNSIDEIRFSVYDPHNLGVGYDYPIFAETGIVKRTRRIVIGSGIKRIEPDGTQFLMFRSAESILIPPSVTYISDEFHLREQDEQKAVRVLGVKGSYAEIYSKEHNMIFEPIKCRKFLVSHLI